MRDGYILLSRKLIESEIWKKPPLYLKVWVWLLSKANFKDYKNLKRGQLITSVNEIREACSHYSGYRKETPSAKQIRTVLEWLRNPDGGTAEGTTDGTTEGTTGGGMVVTTEGTGGILVTICNFNKFQDPKNYGGNYGGNSGGNYGGRTEGTTERPRGEEKGQIKKEERNKKEKKENNDYYIIRACAREDEEEPVDNFAPTPILSEADRQEKLRRLRANLKKSANEFYKTHERTGD